MKIHRVTITIFPPRESDNYPGQIEEGNYFHEDNVVTLVSHAGVPLRDKRGKEYSRKLAAGDDAHQIAGRLLKEFYQSRRPKNWFSKPLHYPKLGLA